MVFASKVVWREIWSAAAGAVLCRLLCVSRALPEENKQTQSQNRGFEVLTGWRRSKWNFPLEIGTNVAFCAIWYEEKLCTKAIV